MRRSTIFRLLGCGLLLASLPGGHAVAQMDPEFTYQGQLQEDGLPANGTYDLRFILYDSEAGGSQVGSIEEIGDVSVTDGLFQVELNFGASAFVGQPRWLEIGVRDAASTGSYSTLSNRQPIKPAPYTIGLLPGAQVQQVATGTALRADSSEGVGFAGLGQVYGIYGSATGPDDGSGYGGYFESDTGIGLYGESTAVPSTPSPLPAGVRGHSVNGAGIFGSAGEFGWAGYFDGNVRIEESLVVADSIFANDKSGYVFDVAINDDSEPLTRGDVVVITGFADEWISERIPIAEVQLARDIESPAVMGVVDRLRIEDNNGMPEMVDEPAHPGDYVGVVTLGAFHEIRVDASYGAISPGDLLVSSPNTGHAMRSDHPVPGTIVGKAMGELDAGTGTIPVLVTLH